MNIKKAPSFKGSLFFTSREIIKEDRERKTSSILLSVGNVFYYIFKTVLKSTALSSRFFRYIQITCVL